MRLDLHGYTVHNAWERFNAFIVDAYYNGHREVTVITGQGAISKELPEWARIHKYIHIWSIKPGNPGCFRINLRKKVDHSV